MDAVSDKTAGKTPGRPLRVLIACPYGYPLFNPLCNGAFGGSEVRMSIIAKWLAAMPSFETHMLVFDHGQDFEVRAGVMLHPWVGGPFQEDTLPSAQEDWKAWTFKTLRRLDSALDGFFGKLRSFGKNRLPAPLWWAGKFVYFFIYLALRGAKKVLERIFRSDFHVFKRRIGPHVVDLKALDIYEEVDADVYIAHGNSEISADMAFFCKKAKKRMLMFSGSDIDVDPVSGVDPWGRCSLYGIPDALREYTIENMYACAVQTERQREMLKANFGKDAVVIRNPMDLSRAFPLAPTYALWIGKSDRNKNPALFLDLAASLPEHRFTIVMNRSDAAMHERLKSRMASMPNVEFVEYVEFDKVESLFSKALVLVNTSAFEGLPNTFLQAAKYEVPILSLNVDPDRMLSAGGCGFCANGDMPALQTRLAGLLRDRAARDALGRKAFEYVRSHHEKGSICAQYAEFITRAARKKRRIF